MNYADLQSVIDDAWEGRDAVSQASVGAVRDAVEAALDALDCGAVRVAEKSGVAVLPPQ